MTDADTQYPADAGVRFQDLSRDELLRLVGLWGNLVRALDGFWYLSVMQQIDNEQALACDIEVWQRLIKYGLDRITEQFDIHGDDLPTLFRTLRFEPMFAETEYRVDFLGEREAVMTITDCHILRALEKDGGGREAQICGQVEPIIMRCYASYFNPDIEVTALQLPPRSGSDSLCCRWRFTLPG